MYRQGAMYPGGQPGLGSRSSLHSHGSHGGAPLHLPRSGPAHGFPGGHAPPRSPSFASSGPAAPLPPPGDGPGAPVPPWLEGHPSRQPASQQLLGQSGYGATAPASAPARKGLWVLPAGRARLNTVAVLVSLVVPWGLFCAVFWALSFSLHYEKPVLAYAVVFAGLLVVLISGVYAAAEARKKVAGAGKVPTWYAFFFATALVAWLAGVVMGDANFFLNSQPFYDMTNLGSYENIDPSLFRGQQLMDAGRIIFTNTTKIDLRRAMGFRSQEMYCVAPISIAHHNGTFETLQTYDFWAVGVGCCSGNNPDFHCGEFNNPSARGGLRLMRDGERAFFRLAVQQAEAAYNIRASHPLFFTWMQDPVAEVSAYQDQSLQFFLVGASSYFVFQLLLVVVAAIVFAKLGRA